MKKLAVIFALLTGVSAAVLAEDNLMLGGSIGRSAMDLDEDDFGAGTDVDEKDTAVKGFVGFRASDVFGVEVGYVDFGTVKVRNGPASLKADTEAWFADILLGLPFTESFSAFVKGGYSSWETDVKQNFSILTGGNGKTDGEDPFYGAGFRMELGTNAALRLEYENFKREDDEDNNLSDIEMGSIGLELLF